MKKILTASLVAMMAVTAANADIASTKYVTDQTGASETGTFTFTNAAKDETTLQGAVNAIAGAVASLSGNGTGSVSDQIDNALSNATAADFSESVQGSLTKADNSVQTTDFNSFKTQNTQDIATAKQEAISTAGSNADSKISTAKAAMKLDATGGAGSFIQQVAQTDGTVTATATAFESDINDTSTVAPQTKAIKSYVDSEISVLSGNNSTLGGKVTSLEQWKTTANASIAENADDIEALQAADTAMDGRVDTLEADNTTNKSNITSLQTAVSSINNPEAAGSVANKIAGVEADLGDVSAANMGTTAGTVVGAIKEVVDEAAAAQAAANTAQSEVNALEGVVAQQKTDLQKAISDGDTATLTAAKEDATTKANAAKSEAISDAAGKYQVKSSKLSIGGANGAWTDLTTEAVGYNATGTYSLVLKEGQIKWEKVSY